ncbi:MAG: hypothetical protein JXR88_09375 [Clostridia bacterium]|nr:hypothetical protein [Clostridia bacterium]
MKRIMSLLLVVVLILSSFVACSNNANNNTVNDKVENTQSTNDTTNDAATPEEPEVPAYEALDPNVEGEITIMLWSGDGSYLEDIGRKDILPEEIGGQNQGAAIAVAKAFNMIYPNVKINIFAKVDGPDDENGTWAQHRENFKAEYGKYPDLFASTDLPGDIAKGLVADLSIFSEDPLYQSFNTSVMSLMNYNGFQGGLPQYLLPWGIFINKSLAEDNNLDVPDPDWTIDDYTDFIAQADMENFYGAMDTPFRLINTGTTSITDSLLKFPSEDYVQLDSDEVATMIDYIAEWSDYAIYPQNEIGNIPVEVMDENWWWGFKFFIENKLLTLEADPWMMGDAAHPAEDHWGRAKAADWDIYPRPSTDYKGNTVGVVLDPFSVYNYAMNDGDSTLSPEEEAQMKLTYTFAAFWTGDTRAWQARADQMFLDGEVLKTSLNDSFPLVTGDEFNNQMNIWYSSETHKRFADADLMPGFHEILDLWEKGQFWDVSDKAYPWYYDFEGARRSNLFEFENMWDVNIVGAMRTEANWADNVKARLAEWDDLSDERFAESFKLLNDGLKEFYNK